MTAHLKIPPAAVAAMQKLANISESGRARGAVEKVSRGVVATELRGFAAVLSTAGQVTAARMALSRADEIDPDGAL